MMFMSVISYAVYRGSGSIGTSNLFLKTEDR